MSESGAASHRISAVRIVAKKFADTAFCGDGARLFVGRWNSPGTAMVYTSGSLSLAILEWRVNLAQWPPPPAMAITVEFDASLLGIPTSLPIDWQAMPAAKTSANFGDEWIRSRRSVILRVPSAVVTEEWNYLINPAHPDFPKLAFGKPRPFTPDNRLGILKK